MSIYYDFVKIYLNQPSWAKLKLYKICKSPFPCLVLDKILYIEARGLEA